MVAWAAAAARTRRGSSTRAPARAASRSPRGAGSRAPGILAVERDPLAALVCRGHLAAAGLAGRARVVVDDYRTADLGRADGADPLPRQPARTCATTRSRRCGRSGWRWRRAPTASRRAGWRACTSTSSWPPPARLQPGDAGAFITSSEWLDTNYGRLVRDLLLGPLGGEAIHVVEPTATPFEDAAVTAAITCFAVARPPRPPAAMRLRRVADVAGLGDAGGRPRGGRRPAARGAPVDPAHARARAPSRPTTWSWASCAASTAAP